MIELKRTRDVILLRKFLDYIEACKKLNLDPLYRDFKEFRKAFKNVKLK